MLPLTTPFILFVLWIKLHHITFFLMSFTILARPIKVLGNVHIILIKKMMFLKERLLSNESTKMKNKILITLLLH